VSSRSRRNGGSRAEEIRKQREEKLEQQKQMRREQGALQDAFNQNGDVSEGFIRELVSNDDLDGGSPEALQEETISKIQNLLSRDVVLSNLTDAQEHDIRMKLEVMKLKAIGAHPPQESYITGDLRAFLMDDVDEGLKPLTSKERMLIDDFFETLKIRATRGRGGFEREQQNTNIARTETQNEDTDQSGGKLSGLFS
jgi:hypothetical protein